MEETSIRRELKLCDVKRENVHKSMEKLKSYGSDLLVFNLQWSDAEDYLKSVRDKVEKRFSDLLSKEMDLQRRSFDIEERAKVVEAAESKMVALVMEVDDKRKELVLVRNLAQAEEIRLAQLKESVEECMVEERSRRSQMDEIEVEIGLKGRKLVQMETDIETKAKHLSLILDETAESVKMLATQTLELGKTKGELELKGKELELVNVDLERCRGELCAEMESLDRSRSCNREVEEEIERKREELRALLDRISECGLVEEQLVAKEKKLVELSLEIDLREEFVKSLNKEMESEAKKLEGIQKLFNERSAEYESIKLLIKEHTQELASKEKKRSETAEAIRTLSLEIVTEEKTLERATVFSKQLSEKNHELEGKLSSSRRHLDKCTAKYESKKKELCFVCDKIRDCIQDQEEREKEVKSLQSLVTEGNRQVEEIEKRRRDLDNASEELRRIIQVKQEEYCSVNKAIKECSDELESKKKHRDQVQRSVTDLTAELKSKECNLNSIKKKIKDNVKDLQLQASLMEREKKLGVKEKAIDAREESINNKDELLKSVEQKLAKCVKDYEQKAKELASFCQLSNPDQQVDLVRERNVSDEKLPLLIRGHLKKCSQLHLELSRALKASSDPAKLVLDKILDQRTTDRNNVQRSSICLLECLLDMSPKPSTEVQGEAIKFATEWKETKLVKAEDPVEVLSFLHFLAVFSSAYTFDTDKVQSIFDVTFLRKYIPSLCDALGVSSLSLVNNGQTLNDKPEQQLLEAPNSNGNNDSRSQDGGENVASTHLDNEDALKDLDGSASLSSSEVFTGLQFLEDPSSYVLNFVNDALIDARQRGEVGLAEPIMKTLVPLLEELPRVVGSSDHLRSEARQVAELWRLMMGTSSQMSPLEAWGLLHLIVAYGLVETTRRDQTLQFAVYVTHFRKAPKLFLSLGLSYAIPDFVKQLLNGRRYIPAVRFICSFKLANMFSTMELVKEEIASLRSYAKEKRRFESQAEKLREIIELIDDFKLDIDLPVDLIVKFMVPREAQKQEERVLFSSGPPTQPPQTVPPVHMQASRPVFHGSYLGNRGLNSSSPTTIFRVPLNHRQVRDMETYQGGGSTAFQAQSSHPRACLKRPRVDEDPRVTSSAIRHCFNPSSGNGRF